MRNISHSWFSVVIEAAGSVPGTPQRVNLNMGSKTSVVNSTAVVSKRTSTRVNTASNVPILNKSDIVPVIVPRTNTRFEQAVESRKDIDVIGRTMPFSLQSKATDSRKFQNSGDEVDQPTVSVLCENIGSKATEVSCVADRNTFAAVKGSIQGVSVTERNSKEDIFTVSGKSGTMSMSESPASYEDERCMYFKQYKYTFKLLVLFSFPI